MFSEDLFDKTIKFSFYLLFFFTPLLLTPYNYELFEFNKMLFVYGMTVIIIGAWLGKMITRTKVEVQRTPLDIPLLLYLASCILSTIFSIEPHTSIWGYYSRFHGGLISTISYILLYYAFVTNIGKTKQSGNIVINCLYILLASAFLVTFYGILEHFGIDAKYWVQDVRNRVFSTLGQPNWLGAFIDALIFIPLGLSFKFKKSSSIIPFLLVFCFYFLFFFCLIFTSSKSAILAFWFGLVIFSIFLLKKSKKQLIFVWLTTSIIYLLMGQRTYHYLKKIPLWLNIFKTKASIKTTIAKSEKPALKKNKPFISESSEIRKVVWQGAIEIWKHYPIFGSGTETFAYSYYNFQPREHNNLSEWDFLYNKAHNEFLNILSCQGTVGIITYLALIGTTIIYSIKQVQKKKKENFIIIALFAGYITILITNFFGFSVVVIGLLFFLFPAFIFVIVNSCKGRAFTPRSFPVKGNVRARPLHYILLFLILYAECFIVNLWRADYFFNQGRKYYQTNSLVDSLNNLQQAIKLNKNEALYHCQLALSSAKLAVVYHQIGLSDQKEASNSAQMINQLKNLSLQETETAIKLNPVNLNSYKNNARVFIYLSTIDSSFQQQALKTILQAIELAPTDAKLFYNLGTLYQQMGQKEKAKEAWKKALALKPNYDKVKRLLK